jgi:glycerol-3-phosphate acyltransferase PlsY
MIPTEALVVLANAAGGYLLGSVPFGWVIGKARGIDIREHGSRNIGATNCWRVCGWPFGLAAFILDVAKGFVPVFVAVRWLVPRIRPALGEEGTDAAFCWLIVTLVALGPLLGHIWPVWLRFKGGKAVATALGVMLGLPMLQLEAAGAFLLWGLVFVATGYVSVASTAAAVAFVSAYLCLAGARAWSEFLAVTALVLLVVALVLVRHRSNYVRLWKGTENRFLWGKKREP